MPNDISLGPVTIHMYGVMIAMGVLVASVIACYRAKKRGMSEDVVYSMLLCTMVGAFVGAKGLYYLTILPQILENPKLLTDIGSGFVVYGGVIMGVLANWLYFKIKKMEFLPYFDLVIAEVPLGQAFGRIGCFFAGCCYGKETDLPIGFTYTQSDFAPVGVSLIPTQLLSSLGDLLLFIVLMVYAKKTRAKGTVAALYFMLYGAGRFFLEFLRGDAARGSVGLLSTSQFIAVIVFFLALAGYVVCSRNQAVSTVGKKEGEKDE